MNKATIRRLGFERTIAFATVAIAVGYTIWLGRPEAALTAGAPPRTDLGGHLVALEHLVEVSIPSGRLFDWSHQWFSGYPSFYFYFPLPALLIATLSAWLPLDAAGKLVAVCAPALLPPATYFLVRASGFGRLYASCAAVGAVALLSLTSQYIFGGNVLSSVIGEYSFAVGFALALTYLGWVALALRGQRRTILLSLTLAATALAHVIPTLFAVLASCVALGARQARRQVISSWLVAFGLAAFWALPFLIRSPYMGHISWRYDADWLHLFPLPVLMILPWTLAATRVLRPHASKLRLLLALAAVALVSYLVPHNVFAQGRTLPVWHFSLYVLTGIAIAAGLLHAWRLQSRARLTFWAAGLVMLVGVSAIQVDIVRKRSFELLSADAPDLASYQSLRNRIAELPPGRLHWEYRRPDDDEELLGGRLPLARLPAAVPNLRTSQGLLVESALTAAPYTYLYYNVASDSFGNRYWQLIANNDRDAGRMRARIRQLGIDYFVTFSEPITRWAAGAGDTFELVDRDSAWTIWRVRGSRLVEPLWVAPHVVEALSWDEAVAGWLESVTDSTPWTVVAERSPELTNTPLVASALPLPAELGHGTVRFRTNAVGVPHVVRVSYFPNWRAHGADGPYLAVPGFMIVIPRRPDVVLRFERTWVERSALAVSLLTFAGLVIGSLARRRVRRGQRVEPAKSEAPEVAQGSGIAQ